MEEAPLSRVCASMVTSPAPAQQVGSESAQLSLCDATV